MVRHKRFATEQLQLYNTLSQRIEPFRPLQSTVTIYICGITPYATTHLGHAFTYVMADTLIRLLEHQDYGVSYVQNLTDIDDAILREARRVGEDYRALGDRWTRHFIQEMQTLNIRPPDHFPRATDVIPEIIDIVCKLCDAGVAYEAGGSVYFDTDRWPSYGRLSRLSRQEMLPTANERGNIPGDLHKRHPIDFVLWQAHAPGEPSWQSPWGPGRPGWHIECSTLVQGFLGETIDIHGGGTDLMFPHHESEIAQSECATGRAPLARWWFHTAMVQLAGRKISKSLGNLIMVQDLLAKYSPDAIRLYLAGHHYRHVWQYDPTELESATNLASLLRTAVRQPVALRSLLPCPPSSRPQAFVEALAHDLDTPEAVKILGAFAQEILSAAEAGRAVQAAQHNLRSMSHLFGLRLDGAGADPVVLAGWNRHLQHTLTDASGL